MTNDTEIKIRDRRANDRYYIDNVFIKRWGAKLGPYCIAVYNVLAMHSNVDNQTSFPSFQTIAELTGMSRRQVVREIDKLKANGIIHVEERKELHPETGKPVFSTNIFTLLHPDEWANSDSDYTNPDDSESLEVMTDSHYPGDSGSPPLVTVSHLNNTQSNNTQITTKKEGPPKKPDTPKAKPPPSNPERPKGVDIFRSVVRRFPDKATWKLIGDSVGESVPDLEFWGEVITGWIACGYNKMNVSGMLDFFNRREVPSTSKNGATNGTHSGASKQHQGQGRAGSERSPYRGTGQPRVPDVNPFES